MWYPLAFRTPPLPPCCSGAPYGVVSQLYYSQFIQNDFFFSLHTSCFKARKVFRTELHSHFKLNCTKMSCGLTIQQKVFKHPNHYFQNVYVCIYEFCFAPHDIIQPDLTCFVIKKEKTIYLIFNETIFNKSMGYLYDIISYLIFFPACFCILVAPK